MKQKFLRLGFGLASRTFRGFPEMPANSRPLARIFVFVLEKQLQLSYYYDPVECLLVNMSEASSFIEDPCKYY